MRPDGGVIVEIVGEMVWHEVLAGCAQVDRIPPLKLCLQSVKYGLGETRVARYRSVFEVDVIPYIVCHVFWSVRQHNAASSVEQLTMR